MRIIYFIIASVLLAVGLMSCDSGHFTVEAELDGLGGKKVRIVLVSDSGLSDTWKNASDGKLQFKGESSQLTLLSLIGDDGNPLALLAVKNGDKVSIKGSLDKPDEWQVKGSDLNERWWAFRKGHADLYAQRGTQLDSAIEDYASSHKEDMLSAVLLMCDHAHLPDAMQRVGKLVQALDPAARPERLLAAFDQLSPLAQRVNTHLQPMLLYHRDSKDFSSLNTKGKVALLYFWTNRQRDRAQQVRLLRDLWKDCADSVLIADVNIEADTTMWQSTLLADSARWQHYWAPGGPEDVALKSLNITSTPLFVVADSTGKQLYRGNDAQAACQMARSKSRGK